MAVDAHWGPSNVFCRSAARAARAGAEQRAATGKEDPAITSVEEGKLQPHHRHPRWRLVRAPICYRLHSAALVACVYRPGKNTENIILESDTREISRIIQVPVGDCLVLRNRQGPAASSKIALGPAGRYVKPREPRSMAAEASVDSVVGAGWSLLRSHGSLSL